MATDTTADGSVADAASAEQIAALAMALQQKLFDLPHQADPSWSRLFDERWPFLKDLQDVEDGMGRQQLFARLVLDQGGGAPDLSCREGPGARLALRGRAEVVSSLCLLALGRRPGVLRCGVERETRTSLRAMLGSAFDVVMAQSAGGRPVSHEVLQWSELHWACVGYHDWAALLRSRDSVWRRLVRMSLPRGLLGMRVRRRLAPADVKARRALQLLEEAGVSWPC